MKYSNVTAFLSPFLGSKFSTATTYAQIILNNSCYSLAKQTLSWVTSVLRDVIKERSLFSISSTASFSVLKERTLSFSAASLL